MSRAGPDPTAVDLHATALATAVGIGGAQSVVYREELDELEASGCARTAQGVAGPAGPAAVIDLTGPDQLLDLTDGVVRDGRVGASGVGAPSTAEPVEALVEPVHVGGAVVELLHPAEPVIDLADDVADAVDDACLVVPLVPDSRLGLLEQYEAATGTTVPRTVHSRATSPWGRAFKRALDLAVGIPVAVVALALLPLLVLLIRVDSPGPVFFRQVRVGRNAQLIQVVKVRTMFQDAEARLAADPELYQRYVANGFKCPDGSDPRITRVGRWLRRTSLDELPQMFCVLRGDMTLVGPRPVLPSELMYLYGPDLVAFYTAVKPGLTGLWQVSGRSAVTNRRRAEIDARYVSEWTPALDLHILSRTAKAVLQGDGAC
jgi:lipopolysaccharide/colanic/teichoic acid biosynthesis glycosyltransferase